LKPSNDSTVTNVTGKLIIQINAKPIINNLQPQATVQQITSSPSQSSQNAPTQVLSQTSSQPNQSFIATSNVTQNSIYRPNAIVPNQQLYTIPGPSNFQRPILINNNNGLPPGYLFIKIYVYNIYLNNKKLLRLK